MSKLFGNILTFSILCANRFDTGGNKMDDNERDDEIGRQAGRSSENFSMLVLDALERGSNFLG